MKKIRTGNDIKVIFTIKGPASTDTVNMKQLRVYFVNNSSETHCCVKRFPKEPFPQFYEPTKYTVHGCGRFEYNVKPSYNKCEYATCMEGFHDYHLWPSYNGFGVKPEKFQDCCGCYCKPEPNDFMASFMIEESTNKVSAYFPACQQRDGVYRMIVVMIAYEAGWGKANLHTYTIDYGEIFELTQDVSGEQGNIIIDMADKELDKSGYIGFSSVESAQAIDINNLTKVDSVKGEKTVINQTGDWAYLWIISPVEISGITISGQNQPIKEFTRDDYKYCYRSYQKLDQTNFKFTII